MPRSGVALFVRPLFDRAMAYGHYYMGQALEYASRRMSVRDLAAGDATKANIMASLEADDPAFCYLLGHGNCYSDDTEILTENGWKRFYDLKDNERVATLDPETDKMGYVLPTHYFKYRYKGRMFSIDGRRINLLVTPNHKLYVSWQGRRKGKFGWLPFRFLEAQDIGKSGVRLDRVNGGFVSTGTTSGWCLKFKRTAKWNCEALTSFELPAIEFGRFKGLRSLKTVKIKDWLRFFGIWIAEGSASLGSRRGEYIISITQNDDYKRKKIKKWVEEIEHQIGFSSWDESSNSHSKCIKFKNKQIYNYLRQFGHSKDKFIPKEIKMLSPNLLEVLLKAMVLGDGYLDDHGGINYDTASKRLADDVQEMALKIGKAATIGRDKRTGVYKVRITEGDACATKISMKWVNYEGDVYCVEVPFHLIYVRRNGRAFWCGNSDTYTAQNQEVVMVTCNGDEVLIGRVTLLLSCSCGVRLAPSAVAKGAAAVFAWAVDFTWVGMEAPDLYSQGFFEAVNAISDALSEGRTTGGGMNLSMATWNSWIEYWMGSDDPYASMVVQWMLHDRDGQRLFGSTSARVAAPTPPTPEPGKIPLPLPFLTGHALIMLSLLAG